MGGDQGSDSRAPAVSFRRRVSRRIAEFWRRFRWAITAAVAALAAVLGFIGWGSVPPRMPIPDRIYATVALFRFGMVRAMEGSAHYPVTLSVARWLAPLTFAYAFFQAVGAVFSEQATRLRVRFLAHDHVIVCGYGRCGSRLAAAFSRAGSSVVVIDHEFDEEDLASCRRMGIRVLRGDARDAGLRAVARLDRAARLVVVTGDDGVNCEITVQVQATAVERKRMLVCHVHIGDETLCRLLEEAALGDSDDGVRVDYFNVYRVGPRALVEEYHDVLVDRAEEPPTLVMVGGGLIGPSIIAEAGRKWAIERHSPERRLRVALIAPAPKDICDRLRQRFSDIDDVCEFHLTNAQPSHSDDPAMGSPVAADSAPGATLAVISEDSDSDCLRATIRLRRILPSTVPVVACTSGHSGVSMLLNRSNEGSNAGVSGFELLDRACRTEVLLNGDNEVIAESIHANWLRNERRRAPGAAESAAKVEWEKLSEEYRQSNRSQAHHIARTLRNGGYQIEPARQLAPEPLIFAPQEIEDLAPLEHRRWMDERLAAGWVYGPKKDEVGKIHPDLRPWDELSEDVKDKDRHAIADIPALLGRAGFIVTPVVGRVSVTAAGR